MKTVSLSKILRAFVVVGLLATASISTMTSVQAKTILKAPPFNDEGPGQGGGGK